jgi:ATP-dependent DNA helicase RecQ
MSSLSSLLHSTFGFSAFRANQEAVCRAATDGKDVLLVMPTGAGKSLCYQLPAIARGGTGLVISPLIALMDDQANKLSAAGLRVARIHSGLSREDSRQACRDYLDGNLQFLFIAPERMRVPGFPEMLARRKPSLIAIDEAHCISAWGHDFRPDYRTLGEHLPALRPAPIIALTATATPTVQKDIVTQLNLSRPALFIHGFRRDNLHIEVLELSKPRRTEFTANFLSDKTRRPAIVYAPSRKAAEELAGELGRRFPAAAYHAGLDPGTRERVQSQFQSGKLEVVVATIAFGMGIDKADVRTVIHYALPASVEAYYQEIGRAGRDGQPSRTVLLYTYADRKMHDFFMERDYPVATELTRVAKLLTEEFQMPDVLRQRLKMDGETFMKAVEKLASQGAAVIDMAGNVKRGATSTWQSGYELQVQHRRSQIDRMMDFAQTQQCRMTALIRHFGDTADAHRPCGHCDFCLPSGTQSQQFDEPTAQEDRALRAILRALEGTSKATGRLHTELALTKERKELDDLLDGLARAGLIQLTAETFTNPEGKVIPYKKASLTHEGQQITSATPLGVVLRSTDDSAPTRSKSGKTSKSGSKSRATKSTTPTPDYTPAQQALDANLRAWRKAEAAKTGKPAFIVFSDSALAALVLSQPQTIPQLLQVSGFGPDKAERYGADITAICRQQAAPVSPAAPKTSVPHSSQSHRDEWDPQPQAPATKPKKSPRQKPPPAQQAAAPAPTLQTFTRERTTQVDPTTLTADQQALELRLRAWRKSESERLGLPQFFVLGTSTLRTIVVEHPRTLAQLQSIAGIGPEKIDKYGPSILQAMQP